MEFGHYHNEGARLAADLANSLGTTSAREYLPDAHALATFLAEHEIQAPARLTLSDLAEVRALRTRFREIFTARDERTLVAKINRLLDESGASPRITDHDQHPWHFHYVPADASVARRMASFGAMGLAAVVCEFGADRLGTCADDRCDDAFVDTSRNRSRRYCSDKCATRSNVAAYRARKKIEHTSHR